MIIINYCKVELINLMFLKEIIIGFIQRVFENLVDIKVVGQVWAY